MWPACPDVPHGLGCLSGDHDRRGGGAGRAGPARGRQASLPAGADPRRGRKPRLTGPARGRRRGTGPGRDGRQGYPALPGQGPPGPRLTGPAGRGLGRGDRRAAGGGRRGPAADPGRPQQRRPGRLPHRPRGGCPGRDRPRLSAASAGPARPVARGRTGRRGDGCAGAERRSRPVRDPGGLGEDAGRGAGGGDARPVPPPGRNRAGSWRAGAWPAGRSWRGVLASGTWRAGRSGQAGLVRRRGRRACPAAVRPTERVYRWAGAGQWCRRRGAVPRCPRRRRCRCRAGSSLARDGRRRSGQPRGPARSRRDTAACSGTGGCLLDSCGIYLLPP